MPEYTLSRHRHGLLFPPPLRSAPGPPHLQVRLARLGVEAELLRGGALLLRGGAALRL